ncbi:MAG: hypothetical protein R3B70_43685 [Polyangiaceae bacterium]
MVPDRAQADHKPTAWRYPVADATRIEDLDRLVLVWLLVPRKKPSTKSLASALSPHARKAGVSPDSVARQSLARLKASGDIEPDTALMLSPAGRKKALGALGLPEIPRRASWKWVQTVLVARGIPVEPTQATLRRVSEAGGLAVAVLQAEEHIQSPTPLSLSQMGNWLAWAEVGVDSTAPFSRKAVLTHALHRRSPGARLPKQANSNDIVRAIAGAKLGVSRADAAIRAALVTRWVRSASPHTGPSLALAEPTTPRPEPPPAKVPPVPTDPADLRAFADRVVTAARAATSGRWGEHKIFISQVWDDLRASGAAPELDAFKQQLVRANQLGLLALSRADLVEVMDPTLVERSRVAAPSGTFHFVRID